MFTAAILYIKHTNLREMIDWLFEHLSTPLIIEPENKFRSVCIEITILYLNKSKWMSIIRLKPLHPKHWVPQSRLSWWNYERVSRQQNLSEFHVTIRFFLYEKSMIHLMLLLANHNFQVPFAVRGRVFHSLVEVHNDLLTENKYNDLWVSLLTLEGKNRSIFWSINYAIYVCYYA